MQAQSAEVREKGGGRSDSREEQAGGECGMERASSTENVTPGNPHLNHMPRSLAIVKTGKREMCHCFVIHVQRKRRRAGGIQRHAKCIQRNKQTTEKAANSVSRTRAEAPQVSVPASPVSEDKEKTGMTLNQAT